MAAAARSLVRSRLIAGVRGSVRPIRSASRHFSSAAPLLKAEEFQAYRLDGCEEYNHDSRLLRFRIDGLDAAPTAWFVTLGLAKQPDPEGLPVRSYTPINLDRANPRWLELLVKVYPDGVFTRQLAQLPADAPVWIRGPRPKLQWTPNKVDRLYLLAGGTGVAPMLQLTQRILSDPRDRTEVHLVFGNKSERDILLREELERLEVASRGQFRVTHVLEEAPAGWQGPTGRIDAQLLQQIIPAPAPGLDMHSSSSASPPASPSPYLICTCGPPPMTRALAGTKGANSEYFGLLRDLGHAEHNVYKF